MIFCTQQCPRYNIGRGNRDNLGIIFFAVCCCFKSTVNIKGHVGTVSYIHVINFKEASGRFFFHFLEVFEKCIEYIRIIFIHFREISKFW